MQICSVSSPPLDDERDWEAGVGVGGRVYVGGGGEGEGRGGGGICFSYI